MAGHLNDITEAPFFRTVAFARAVGFGDVETALYFFEKPWKWQEEFDAWTSLGQPTSEADANWEKWQTVLTASESV